MESVAVLRIALIIVSKRLVDVVGVQFWVSDLFSNLSH